VHRAAADLDEALARWATGDADARSTREVVHAELERLSVIGTLVRAGRADTEGPRESEPAISTQRIARALGERCWGQRLLVTPSDASWPKASSEPVSTPSPAWIACEPLELDTTLVAVGWDTESMNDALAVLPRIARALGALASSEDADAEAARQAHALKNLLAGVMANVEYASFLLEKSAPTDGDESHDGHDDLFVALRNALGAAARMTPHIDAMRRLVRRRPPSPMTDASPEEGG